MSKGIIAILFIIVICSIFVNIYLFNEKLAIINSEEIICNSPYIQVGRECCLDENSNSICDSDEPETADEPEKKSFTATLADLIRSSTGRWDLSDYPKPFASCDGVAMIVVGADAPASHIIAASDINARLSQVTCGDSSVGSAVVKLDVEVTSITSRPLILVGGPDYNRITAALYELEYPTEVVLEEGLISIENNAFGGNHPALVVMGPDDDYSVRDAAKILKEYQLYRLSGYELLISEVRKK